MPYFHGSTNPHSITSTAGGSDASKYQNTVAATEGQSPFCTLENLWRAVEGSGLDFGLATNFPIPATYGGKNRDHSPSRPLSNSRRPEPTIPAPPHPAVHPARDNSSVREVIMGSLIAVPSPENCENTPYFRLSGRMLTSHEQPRPTTELTTNSSKSRTTL
jgi:hypothetical protein